MINTKKNTFRNYWKVRTFYRKTNKRSKN